MPHVKTLVQQVALNQEEVVRLHLVPFWVKRRRSFRSASGGHSE